MSKANHNANGCVFLAIILRHFTSTSKVFLAAWLACCLLAAGAEN